MRGYLQRLAGSVMQPMETVHPLAGSVFSPETPIEQELPPSSGGPPLFPAPETRTEPETLPANANTISLDPSEASVQRPTAREAHPVRSLPTPSISRSEPPAASQRIQNLNLILNEAASSQLHPAVLQKRASETGQPVRVGEAQKVQEAEEARASAYTPLMQVNAFRPNRQARLGAISSSETSSVHARQRADTSHPAEREPEEIQIHIGRIEVTAVPQAPATAPGKVLCRSLSLDEYLRRRDGRTI